MTDNLNDAVTCSLNEAVFESRVSIDCGENLAGKNFSFESKR